MSNECGCREQVKRFREDLLREMSYSHWGESELYAFKKALKWFDQIFGNPA